MAIMIPNKISEDSPISEKIIFENLMRAPQARDWVIFHSSYVNNHRNPTRPREIDFIILIPDNCSVICLEVKGGSYRFTEGLWYLLPSNEPVSSPLNQARTAMFTLKDEFRNTHFSSDSLLSLGCAVVFTDGEPSRERTPSRHMALLIGAYDARDPDRLSHTLKNYAEDLPPQRVRNKLNTPIASQLAQVKLANLQHDLEPSDMIIKPPETIFRADLETLRPQLLRLTSDQLNSLKRVRLNDRCVIDGAAGTGKTVLAMELARQRCDQGETVALLCSNPNLSDRFARWAKTLPNARGGRVVASTPAILPFWAFREDDALKDKHRQRLTDSPRLEESLKRGYRLDDKWPSFIDETVEDLGEGSVLII